MSSFEITFRASRFPKLPQFWYATPQVAVLRAVGQLAPVFLMVWNDVFAENRYEGGPVH